MEVTSQSIRDRLFPKLEILLKNLEYSCPCLGAEATKTIPFFFPPDKAGKVRFPKFLFCYNPYSILALQRLSLQSPFLANFMKIKNEMEKITKPQSTH